MRLVHLTARNFRGIRELTWAVPAAERVHCLVGPCDVRKTTILEAIDLALCDRWAAQFTDADFYGGDPAHPIVLEATVADLPVDLETEDALGHFLRGWDDAKSEFIVDPEESHEFVLTVRLEVDKTLEPVWSVIKPGEEPRRINAEQRAALGAAWLGGESERHLTWARGSALWRTTERAPTKPLLADALRAARGAVSTSTDLAAFNDAASRVQKVAAEFGVRARTGYISGLDPHASKMGTGMLALHDGVVSALQAGMGTRRLLALSVQRLSVLHGAILLIDEIEHGLEPHRLRRLIAMLRKQTDEPTGIGSSRTLGQALLTTHSPIALVELKAPEVKVVREANGVVTVIAVPQVLQAVVRRGAEAFLASKVIVCEGKTEIGILRALDERWAGSHGGVPMATQGVALVDGGGRQAPAVAKSFASLGYSTALFMDSDDSAVDAEVVDLTGMVHVVRWADKVCTEQRIALDAPVDVLDALVTWARGKRGDQSILDAVRGQPVGSTTLVGDVPSSWIRGGADEHAVRVAIGEASRTAGRGEGWYKQVEPAEEVGALVMKGLDRMRTTDLALKLDRLESWVYGA